MSIVQTDIPITSTANNEYIDALVKRYPFCRSEILTMTAYGRPIKTLVIGRGARKLVYTAAHHANEWITAYILLKFCEEFAEALENGGCLRGIPASVLAAEATFYMVPLVNPDGVDLVTEALLEDSPGYEEARAFGENYPLIPFPSGWKANLKGVDLNLNYPAGWEQAKEIKFRQGYTLPGPRDFVGLYPLNQPETIALAGYTEYINPALVYAFHSQGEVIYWQFNNIFVDGARELGEKLEAVSGYLLADTPYVSSFAGYKDWFIQYFRKPGYTIEVGQGENPLPLSQFPEIYRACLGMLILGAIPGLEPDQLI